MLSETQIQLKAQQYLQRFEQTHQKKQNLLKELQVKVNSAAIKIQRMWKSYKSRKRNYYARVIQHAWRKYRLWAQSKRIRIKRFKEVFCKGKIAWFVYKKYFKKDLQKVKQKCHLPLNKYHLQQKILATFPSSQISYIQKLRLYQKQKFSSSWQTYQEKLIKQLQKQATKKWVKKNQIIWITQEGKEVNLAQYIEKNVEKIFQREYNKYYEADKKLEGTVAVLREKTKQFEVIYYKKTLQRNNETK